MKTETFREKISFYQQRFGYEAPQIPAPSHPKTELIIVIPCYDEPNLTGTLESLATCQPPQAPVEVIVVVNQGVNTPEHSIAQNQQTVAQANEWIATNHQEWLTVHIIKAYNLPKKSAGVGLARKIGMDEALYRLGAIGNNGGIVCLDADCRVASNYLVALEQAFAQGIQSASIHFEHRPDVSEVLQEGIVQYELFLRYYVAALRLAGFPYAYHTIGSSMAVRAHIYALSGGMNRRKAGEDFYFLHKIAPLGKYYEISQTTVYPSSRTSHRVPFGTGKAQQKWLDHAQETLSTYDPKTFSDLKAFLDCSPQLFQINDHTLKELYKTFPASIQAFFGWEEFAAQVQDIDQKTATLESFLKRWYHWLDGLKILKYVHFARDHYYPEIPIHEASQQLLNMLKHPSSSSANATALLETYRTIDKSHQGMVAFF
ncbi:glycosyltransferase family 2 protein [uncultured Microscilla sp.]|uniref:glycosyltransferase n=1 Tax=uncultured Microscilla sp. TaxID=432653 RepID=UPI00260E54CF|nr:glycosyltransferase family 2 protein [uncultured Microscilla sp.]